MPRRVALPLITAAALTLPLTLGACHHASHDTTHRREAARQSTHTDRDGFRRDLRAGTLTAGHFDDGDEPGRFADWAGRVGVLGEAHGFPQGFDEPAIQVRVVNEHGDPVHGAVVTLYSDRQGRGQHLLTGTDGRCVVIPGYDGVHRGKIDIRVTAEGVRSSRRSYRAFPGEEVEVVVPGAEALAPRRLDLALIIDTTGSMGDELAFLKVEFRAIVERVAQRYPHIDQRWALVVYRDAGDAYVVRHDDFTSRIGRFVDRLGEQHASGGGDYPEAVARAMGTAADLDWRGDAVKLAFLIADAPPHPDEASDMMRAVSRLRAQGVGVYPVASSGVQAEAEFVFRAAALMTGGAYSFLTDDSGVGNPHADPHETPGYSVQRLDDLMVQLIESELIGAPRPPRQRDIVRDVPADGTAQPRATTAEVRAWRRQRSELARLLATTQLSPDTTRAIEAEIATLDRRLDRLQR